MITRYDFRDGFWERDEHGEYCYFKDVEPLLAAAEAMQAMERLTLAAEMRSIEIARVDEIYLVMGKCGDESYLFKGSTPAAAILAAAAWLEEQAS